MANLTGMLFKRYLAGMAGPGEVPAPAPASGTTYSMIPEAYNVNEGDSLTFNVTGTNIADGTYYWTIVEPLTESLDVDSSGSFTITGGTGSFSVIPYIDFITEGPETFTTYLRTGSITGPIVASSSPVTINDTSLTPAPPTYSVTPAASNVNEGSSLTFNVTGTNIVNGTYYWTVSRSGDFAVSSGSFIITNGAGSFNGSFSVTPTADNTTEGAETFTASVRTGSVTGTIVATSSTVTINDTSTAPVPTYTVTPVTSTVNEGRSLVFNVAGTNIVNGTYYWTVSNGGDFGTSSGSFTITSNTGSFSVTPAADFITEGSETFTASVRTGSITGTVVATSSTVTINDTITAAAYSAYFDGDGDWLDVANNTALQLGTQNFTMEAWIYPTASGQLSIFSKGTGSSSGFTLYLATNQTLRFTHGASTTIVSSGTVPLNSWSHVAAVREGTGSNQFKLYINGLSVATATVTTSFTQTNVFRLGTGRDATVGLSFDGYISNARIVKGTAIYASNFTVPTTPLTAVSGTSLLACQSSTLVDNSGNNFTITVVGNTAPSSLSPFVT